jgi:hypothetical protein
MSACRTGVHGACAVCVHCSVSTGWPQQLATAHAAGVCVCAAIAADAQTAGCSPFGGGLNSGSSNCRAAGAQDEKAQQTLRLGGALWAAGQRRTWLASRHWGWLAAAAAREEQLAFTPARRQAVAVGRLLSSTRAIYTASCHPCCSTIAAPSSSLLRRGAAAETAQDGAPVAPPARYRHTHLRQTVRHALHLLHLASIRGRGRQISCCSFAHNAA